MGIFTKTVGYLKEHLGKTRKRISSGLSSILTMGRNIDEDLLEQLEETLISDDIGVETTTQLIDDLREAYKKGRVKKTDDILPFLKEHMKGYWPEQDRQLHKAADGPTVILVAGINGSGKTTSIAKLAYTLNQAGNSVIVAACDTFRAAAVEQLTIWAERIGVQIVKHKSGADPAAVAYDACAAAIARKADYLIMDTAGRLHTQKHLMEELSKIRNVITKQIPDGPHEVILVVDGIFLAKLDGTARGGIVIAIKDMLDIPVKFVGLGETPEDIAEFNPDEFVEALFA